MPTIPQLPPASSVSPSDEIPISQGGSVHAVSVGTLLLAAQPVITVQSPSLLGRSSLGSGGPEQIDVGTGMNLAEGTVVANGADHATYPVTASLLLDSDLVISNLGSQMLMPTGFLRGLFSAGQDVTIDGNGVISAIAGAGGSQTALLGTPISGLRVVSSMLAQDLVPVSHAGTNLAITYANLLDGLTIDQAPQAGPAADSDVMWVAQSTNVMASQTLGAVWLWISNNLPKYQLPVLEVATNVSLTSSIHNGRVLVCSQPVTLMPNSANMGSGFLCQVINVSSSNVTLGPGFQTSNGSFVIAPQQTVQIQCITYSGGTLVYASMPQTSTTVAIPGQVSQLIALTVTATSITLAWQPPSAGGIPSYYLIQYRQSGSTSWTAVSTVVAQTSYQLTSLQSGTSYDIEVQATNATGMGSASPILTTLTAVAVQLTPPPQVSGLVATAISSSNVQLVWAAQSAAATYTVQYRVTGSTVWTSSLSGIAVSSYIITGLQAATGYDFSVFGVNANGAGQSSPVVSATTVAAGVTLAVPGQVIGLTASGIAAASVTLNWQSPASGGAASGYTVQYRQTGATAWITSATLVAGTSYQLAGLQPVTSYDMQVQASNLTGLGAFSSITTVSTAQIPAPSQVSGVAAVATSSSAVQLSWTGQTGTNAAATYTVQYRTSGTSVWASTVAVVSASSYVVTGLQMATRYDFSVFGVNAGGPGPTSSVVSATTTSVGNSVTSITWNLAPSGSYVHASGAIGVNAHVLPSSAAVQFGFSTSNTVAPASWTAALLVNTDLWGAYVPTPAVAGNWYAWVEGVDGSSVTVFPTPFVVQ